MTKHVIEAVQGGTETIETCPGFEHERIRSDLAALMLSGVLVIGELVSCETCGRDGTYFACAACDTLTAFDGADIHRHIATHGERISA